MRARLLGPNQALDCSLIAMRGNSAVDLLQRPHATVVVDFDRNLGIGYPLGPSYEHVGNSCSVACAFLFENSVLEEPIQRLCEDAVPHCCLAR